MSKGKSPHQSGKGDLEKRKLFHTLKETPRGKCKKRKEKMKLLQLEAEEETGIPADQWGRARLLTPKKNGRCGKGARVPHR